MSVTGERRFAVPVMRAAGVDVAQFRARAVLVACIHCMLGNKRLPLTTPFSCGVVLCFHVCASSCRSSVYAENHDPVLRRAQGQRRRVGAFAKSRSLSLFGCLIVRLLACAAAMQNFG